MPKYLDRSTRQLVWQYGNGAAMTLDGGENSADAVLERKTAAPKAFEVLEKLLDACVAAEANRQRGRTPMVTVHWIRKQITDGLSDDG